MNRFDMKEKKQPGQLRIFSTLIVFLCGIFCLLRGVASLSDTSEKSQADSLLQALKRSAVHCYAVEGRYPESLDYLKEYYGIHWNPEHYAVDYEVFASNLMPSITVIPLNQ